MIDSTRVKCGSSHAAAALSAFELFASVTSGILIGVGKLSEDEAFGLDDFRPTVISPSA